MRVRNMLAVTALIALATGTAQAQTTIKAVMSTPLRITDPILTTGYTARDHGYMVYDTLFATNEKFEVKPQMVKEWSLSDDKLTYTFTLRDGLKWHDGQPVTTADVIPSLKRWAARDTMGQKLMDFTRELAATDDKTFKLVLKEPYGLVLESLGKVSSNVPFIMPKRLAEVKPTEAIPEQVGSGPFKFIQAEFQPGVKTIYVKNTDYVPRPEPVSWFAGGKVVKVDRVEWLAMPDPNTTMNALISNEIDFIESLPHDLLPIVKAAAGVKAEVHNTLGIISMLRMNFLHPPLNDKRVRQAILHAVTQKEYMDAQVGDPEYYKLCPAIFICGTPLETTAGSEPLMKKDLDKARALLKEAGYKGEPVVVLHTPDQPTLSPYSPVTSQVLKSIGLNVEMIAIDWQSMLSRRAKMDPPKEGGWGIFHTTWVSADMLNPVMQGGLNARGPKNGGWFGWPDDPEMERLRDEFARTTDPTKQKALAETIQKRAYDEVMYIMLGLFYQVAVSRDSTSGWIKVPATVFWNVEKKG